MRTSLSFNAKMAIGSIGVVFISILVLTAVTIWQIKSSMHEIGKTSIGAVGDTLYRDIQVLNDITQEKVVADIDTFSRAIEQKGLLYLNRNMQKKLTITNQVSKEQESVEIPTMTIGGDAVDNNELVDRLQELAGGTATIFQVLPGKLLRISTNVKKLDGTRATGTYIPDNSPVYQTVMKGEVFRGKAFVVNAWYITAYKPIRDIKGDIAAVIYVGRPILNAASKKLIEETNIRGKGHAFVYNTKGDIIVQPKQKIDADNIGSLPYGERLLATLDGYVDYTQDNVARTVYVRYFEPWDWNIVVGLDDEDMVQGADLKLIKTNGIIAIALLVVATLLSLSLGKVISRPLRRLADYTGEIAQGNFDATISYEANDAIGTTIDAVKEMVGVIKNKVGVSEGILNGMAVPFLMVDTEEKITHVNRRCLDMLELDGNPDDYKGWRMGKLFYNDPSRSTVVGKCMNERSTVHDLEVQITGHKGHKKNVIANVTYLADHDGAIIGGFCIYLDVTQARTQELLIREQNDKIARVAQEANNIAELVASAAEQLSAQIEQATRGADIQSQRAGETATAMEEMNATVLEVARNASQASESAESARSKAQDGAAKVQQVVEAIGEVDRETKGLRETMDELGQQASGIGQIIGVINDIADQTNLLALNAAIEAARAGDAGRGFAVVADEVRKLAEKTMNATREVGSAISAIQQGTDKSVTATNKATQAVNRSISLAQDSGTAMREIVSIVEGTAGQVTSIATASEQQSAASEEINRSVEEINRISAETADGMRQSAQAVTELAGQSIELKRLIDEMQK